MATASYLPDTAGGMVVAAAFIDDERALAGIALLRSAGVRLQDLSVVTADAARAARIAADQAWTPWKSSRGRLARLRPGGAPADVRKRYAHALRDGQVVLVAAADGQPPDTLAALLTQAGGMTIERWWQTPGPLFAPPELAGPF
ncbi:MAG: hypothetical protein Q7S25_04940 [Candidatus Limnocylindria bacterium]|nr:hypothetical protein [Candidatus Limnocylindria bacterium]